MRRCILLCLLAVPWGCSSTLQPVTKGPVSAVEITEDGQRKWVPDNGVTDIDVNSSVELLLDEEAVKAAFSGAAGSEAGGLKSLDQRAKALTEAIAAEKQVCDYIESRLRQPVPTAQIPDDMKKLAQLENNRLKVLNCTLPREEVNRLLGLGVCSPGVVAALERHNSDVQRDLDAINDRLERVRWRMQATVMTKRGPELVHLDGYDTLTSGHPNVVDKLAIPKELPAIAAQARKAATDLGDLQKTLLRTRELLLARADEFRTRLRNVGADVGELRDLLDELRTAKWATQRQAQGLIRSAETLSKQLQETRTVCRAAFERVAGGASAQVIVQELLDSGSTVRSCVSKLQESSSTITRSSREVDDEVRFFRTAVERDAQLGRQVGKDWIAKLDKLRVAALSSTVSELVGWWADFDRALMKSAGMGTDVVFAPPETATDRSFRELQNTRIDLVRTMREPGDLVTYRSAVVRDVSETSQWRGPTMRVVVTGFHIDVSASVVFVRALDVEDHDASFPAAPAATASLHYTVPRSDGVNRSGSTFNFINPGICLHIAYLDLGPKTVEADKQSTDPSTEIGIGGVVQLFGDVLQAGVAYDLQAERSYGFVGVGLQTLTNFGLTVPSAGN